MSSESWLCERLLAVAARMARAEDLVLAGDPAGVHDLRVALRTARSLLTTYRPLLDDAEVPTLADDLRWAGEELGANRDVEVLQEHLAALARGHGSQAERSEALALAEASVAARMSDGRHRTEDVLGSRRYRSSLDGLRRQAGRLKHASPDRAVALLAPEWRRTRRRVAAAQASDPRDPRHVEVLHRARKAAKRGRYAAEALVPVFGDAPEAMAAAARAVQEALGDHRDALLVRETLRRVAETAPGSRSAFARLDACERQREEQALAEFAVVAPRLQARWLRRWLRSPDQPRSPGT